MAESIPSQINFPKLLSHTFPGIFTTIGIFMVIQLIFYPDATIKDFHFKNIFENWETLIGVFGGLIFFGTIVGIIIDSFHHQIEDIIMNKTDLAKEIKIKENEVYKDLNNNRVGMYYFIGFLPLERIQFLIDNHYSYVEYEFNLSLSFFISAFIYSYFIFKLGYNIFTIFFVFFTLILLSFYFFYSATKNYLGYKMIKIDFIKGALEGKKINKSP